MKGTEIVFIITYKLITILKMLRYRDYTPTDYIHKVRTNSVPDIYLEPPNILPYKQTKIANLKKLYFSIY